MLHTVLLPATHLAADLQAKLKLLVSQARRAFGPMPPPAAPAGALTAAAGVFPAVLVPSGPPCLEGITLQQFVQQHMGALLPTLQEHMTLALNVIKEPLQGGVDVMFTGG